MAKPTYEELLEVVSEFRRLLAERDRQIAELGRSVEELRRAASRSVLDGRTQGQAEASSKPGKKYGNHAVRLPENLPF